MWVENFNISKNFWEENPQTKVIFKDYFNSDKSKNKETSSKVMWAIAFFCDSSSKWKGLPEKTKKAEIKNDYLDIDWEDIKIKDIIDKYRKYDSSKSKYLLDEWESKLEDRNNFMSSIQYSESTYEMLDKMLASTKKMWDEYARIKKDFESENQQSSSLEGDVEESDTEKGLI